MFDGVRCRTLWLTAPHSLITSLFTTSLSCKVVCLVVESCEKGRYLPSNWRERQPEAISSILNRWVFFWLNRLLIKGSHNVLHVDDLYDLSSPMLADEAGKSFQSHWVRARLKRKHTAMFALIKTLRVSLLVPVLPRAILLGLTVCQPILLRELLAYLSAEDPPKNTGYGMIGAYAVVYTGSALSSGFYWYKQYQFLTMVRACLVPAISWKTARLDIISANDPKAAVTLMSTDVECIMDGLTPLHDF